MDGIEKMCFALRKVIKLHAGMKCGVIHSIILMDLMVFEKRNRECCKLPEPSAV